jgi:hypothetical protein
MGELIFGFLELYSLFQAFLSHKEYPKIRSESSKPPFWPAVMDFQGVSTRSRLSISCAMLIG